MSTPPPRGPASAPPVSVHRDLAEVDLARWDALLGPRGFYAAGPWLRHAQATADRAPYYFTAVATDITAATATDATVATAAARGGEAEAVEWLSVLPAYPLEPDTPYVFCSPGRVVEAGHREATGEPAPWAAALMPALACGGRNPSHTKAGVNPGLDSDRQRSALGVLVDAAEREAWAAGLEAVSFLYVDEDDEPLLGALAERGYARFPGQTAYSLTVPPDGSFDSYLAGFEQRRRVKIKRELRALEEAGVVYRTRPLDPELIDRVAPLEMALYAKHGTPANAEAFRAVLHSVARNAGEAARVTTAEVGGRLAGFVLTFTHRGEMYARQTGFDYDVQGKLPLYFGLVYYELLRIALAEGLTHINYSTGSDREKLSRGCVPRRQLAHLKARRPETAERLDRFAQALARSARKADDTP